MGISEGIESGLAAHVFTGLPVWAARCAQALKSVVVPDSVLEVVIFADNDFSGEGQTAAEVLEARLSAEGKKVTLSIPPMLPNAIKGTDWADILVFINTWPSQEDEMPPSVGTEFYKQVDEHDGRQHFNDRS